MILLRNEFNDLSNFLFSKPLLAITTTFFINQSPTINKNIKVLEPPWIKFLGKVVYKLSSEANFNFFNNFEYEGS